MFRLWHHGFVAIVAALVLFFTQISTGSAMAAGVTPSGPERFASNHATYVITTKSSYYRKIWQSAVAAWDKTGAFHFVTGSSRTAQIHLTTATKKQAAALGEDVGLTDYSAHADYLTKVTSTLNPTLLTEYGYAKSDILHVAEHELGHAMGLAHNPSKKSVMYYRNRAEGIQKVDVEGVILRYETPAGQSAR